MSEQKKLAQSGDTMFERNISVIAASAREVEVDTDTGLYIGFIAGLDEEYIQICRTDNQELTLLNRDYIIKIEPTGRTLDDAERSDTPGVHNVRDKIETFVYIAGKHNDRKRRR